ncbi:MAG: choice-of-anchor J domain-containing protein [Acidobacteria bacterium]|nr:choice-of-anchor J domain-containing protein [Acidobacteriota bacterium]MBI3422710.1 choice-of-anchor J domain-containing protein [Acidobacteriota bacterium]
MRTLHKLTHRLTHRPLARHFLTLVFFLGLSVLGWHLPTIGAATLAYSKQAYQAARASLGQALTVTAKTNAQPLPSLAAPGLAAMAQGGISAEQLKLVRELLEQLENNTGEFSLEEKYLLGKVKASQALTQLEVDTLLSRVLYEEYVARRPYSKGMTRLLAQYRAAVAAANRTILDEAGGGEKGGAARGVAGAGVKAVTAPTVPNAPLTASFNEGFDDITTLSPAGWFLQNNSNPLGTTNWFQGNPAVFPSQGGATNSYIGANFNNTSGAGTISNWLLTPQINFQNGDVVKFWTRTTTGTFPDRIEVRLSKNGASTNVGTTETSVGDFTTLLLSVNPSLDTTSYPTVFTEFTVTISGLPAGQTPGRVGFRYFVTNGGPSGANSDFIGIDTFSYTLAPPPAVLVKGTGTITVESCVPANTVLDPGETVTVSLCISNSGTGASGSVVGTLVPNGQFLNPSGAQTYGVVPTGGAPVCRNFTFTVPSNAVCGGNVTVPLALTDGGNSAGTFNYVFPIGTTNAPMTTTTFSQNTPIVISTAAPPNPGSVYPSALTVAGVTDTVTGIKVNLNGTNHTFTSDLDIMLVGPTGASVILMSDAGSSADLVNTNLSFVDGAPYLTNTSTPNPIPSGNYSPTNYGTGDTFSAPAPAVPVGGPLNATFGGLNPNGTWNLFVMDDASGDGGSITSWSIEFTTTSVVPTVATTPFTNAANIAFPADPPGSGNATPYPSTINVSGLSGSIRNIVVSLNGVNHTFPSDMDFLLVGPTGVGYTLLSDVGGSTDAVNATFTIQDGAVLLPTTLAASQTFGPSNSGTGDIFPAPAPATFQNAPSAGTASILGTFGGLSPNGTWSLYAVDDLGGDTGNLSGGWTISFTTVNFPTTCAACALCTLTPPTNITTNVAAGTCAATVNYAAPGTSGTCGTVTCTPASGSSFAKGVTTVTCTSSTGGGTTSFTVTVNDNIAPVITCPANITTNVAAGTCAATVNYSAPTVTDNCPGVGAPTCVPASGSTFQKGTTTVNCTVQDASANSASCSFTVTVVDNIPPVLTCPADINVGTAGTTSVVTFTNPTGTDNCPPTTLASTCNPPSGFAFPLGTTTVTCTVTDAANNTTTCAFRVNVNKLTVGSLSDPLACTGPGSKLSGSFTVTNNSNVQQSVSATVTLGPTGPPQGLLALTCTASSGTCTIAANQASLSYTATLAAGASATVSYILQVNDGVAPGTVLTSSVSASFNGGPAVTAGASTIENCPLAGAGAPFITAAERTVMSDQRAGSVLLYPIYTSEAAGGSTQNARISLTNISDKLNTFVHLFFVDGSTCSVSDAFVCLTANQTSTFLTSDLDPGTRGYIVAVAVDALGCPRHFNYLIGDEFVKFSTGHSANLGAEAIAAIAGSTFWVSCDGSQPTATLPFNGTAYGNVPYTLAADNLPSTADGNNTLLVINRIGGDLQTGPGRLVPIFGTLYDDAEISYSFNLPTNNLCQFVSSLSDSTPRTTPRLSSIIPAGRSGWFKLSGTSEIGIFGATINRNPNSGASSGAFNGGHNLHKITFTSTMTYTIPVFPPTC